MKDFLKGVYGSWMRSDPFTSGAALAYYALFSLPAMIVIIIAIASTFISKGTIETKVMAELQSALGKEAASTIKTIITASQQARIGIVAKVIGAITLVVGSLGAFGQLELSLNKIWDAPTSTTSGLVSFIREKIAALLVIIALGFLLMVSLITSTVIPFFYAFIDTLFPYTRHFIVTANMIISFVFLSLLFICIYAFLPNTRISKMALLYGGCVTAFLFTIGKFIIQVYLHLNFVLSGYGAASAIVIILLWAYYSSQVFLLGAACTYMIDDKLKKD